MPSFSLSPLFFHRRPDLRCLTYFNCNSFQSVISVDCWHQYAFPSLHSSDVAAQTESLKSQPLDKCEGGQKDMTESRVISKT